MWLLGIELRTFGKQAMLLAAESSPGQYLIIILEAEAGGLQEVQVQLRLHTQKGEGQPRLPSKTLSQPHP